MSDENLTPTPEDRGDLVTEPEATEAPAEDRLPVAPQPEPAAKLPEREIHIPKERFDEVNERYREERQARLEAEARLRDLQTPKPPPFDAKAVEKAYLAAVAEGDVDKAATLSEQIRDHDRRGIVDQLSAQVRRELDATREQMTLETAVEAVVEKYPFLDSTSAEASPDAIKEVVEWRDYYMVAKRLPPAQALKQAVNRVVPAYVKAGGQGAAEQAGADRTQAQRLANAKAAAALPPNTAQMGLGERAARAGKADVVKMSDAEFAALPDDERAKLRGDTVT